MEFIAKLLAVQPQCAKPFFGIPHWFDELNKAGKIGPPPGCEIINFKLADIWLVGASLVRMALSVAALVAVAFVLYGGFLYITSGGNADRAGKALETIINALVGLIIAILASTIVGFVAGRFS